MGKRALGGGRGAALVRFAQCAVGAPFVLLGALVALVALHVRHFAASVGRMLRATFGILYSAWCDLVGS